MRKEFVIAGRLNYNSVTIEMAIINSEDRFLTFWSLQNASLFGGAVAHRALFPIG